MRLMKRLGIAMCMPGCLEPRSGGVGFLKMGLTLTGAPNAGVRSGCL